MNMKKIALASAVAALSTSAFAAQDLTLNLQDILQDYSANGSGYEGTFVNLAVTNSDLIDAAVSISSEIDALSDATIATTSIGAVQSGDVSLAVSSIDKTIVSDDSTSTATNNTVVDTDKTLTANIQKTTEIASAKTSSTATSLDTTDLTDTSVTTDTSKTTNDIDNSTATVTKTATDIANTSAFGVANFAYNNASIDASVDITANGTGGLFGVQLGQEASITTTAIGAVQSGNITVTVQ